MNKKAFGISIVIGVLLMLVSIGISFISGIRQRIHQDEIIVHTGKIVDLKIDTHFSMDRNNPEEYNKSIYIDLENGKHVSVHEISSDRNFLKVGDTVTVYEWNGDYALNEGPLFLTAYPSHLVGVFFAIGFVMVSLPIYFRFHSYD